MSTKLPQVTQPIEGESGFELRQSDSRVCVQNEYITLWWER